jgi:hypothetical protein
MKKCLMCGLQKSGAEANFVCPDCLQFAPFLQQVYREVDQKLSSPDIIPDPATDRILQLVADSTLFTAQNPQLTIYYKMCELIIQKAYKDEYSLSEEQLNKAIKTIRSWSGVFKLFQELDLIQVTIEDHQRVITLTEKIKRMVSPYVNDPLSDQIIKRHAHIYAGYVLLTILNKVAQIREDEPGNGRLPYGQIPRTLWSCLMFVWGSAYSGNQTFSEEDFRRFLSKRRISSTTYSEAIKALQHMSGKHVQTLIKDISRDGDQITFAISDYAFREILNLRDRVRERQR